jgi:tRNA A22 N-methylase
MIDLIRAQQSLYGMRRNHSCKVCGSILHLRAEVHNGTFRMIYETLCQRCLEWYHVVRAKDSIKKAAKDSIKKALLYCELLYCAK